MRKSVMKWIGTTFLVTLWVVPINVCWNMTQCANESKPSTAATRPENPCSAEKNHCQKEASSSKPPPCCPGFRCGKENHEALLNSNPFFTPPITVVDAIISDSDDLILPSLIDTRDILAHGRDGPEPVFLSHRHNHSPPTHIL